ncbi:MAG: hypothetical protein WC388_09685, partial [Bacteroidales bacterium]
TEYQRITPPPYKRIEKVDQTGFWRLKMIAVCLIFGQLNHQTSKPMHTATEIKICDAVRKMMTQLPQKKARSLNSASRMAGVNLYKYSCKGTVPLLTSLVRYCQSQDLDPGWLVWLCQEHVKGTLKEEQLLEILDLWPKLKIEFESAAHVALGKVLGLVNVPNDSDWAAETA